VLKLLIPLAAALTLAACASTPPVEAPLADSSSLDKKPMTHCLQTGTRIRLNDDQCAAVSGRAFSSEELEQTGEMNLSDALRKLDPSFGR
jgi:hypothetical protein